MAYRQTNGVHKSMNGSPAMNGSGMNGSEESGQMTASQPLGLRGIDPESLKSRLISFAPQQAPVNTKALRFNRVTQTQMRKSYAPIGPKLEPVVFTYFLSFISVFLLLNNSHDVSYFHFSCYACNPLVVKRSRLTYLV